MKLSRNKSPEHIRSLHSSRVKNNKSGLILGRGTSDKILNYKSTPTIFSSTLNKRPEPFTHTIRNLLTQNILP